MFKQCLGKEKAKKDRIRLGRSLSRIILIHHCMPKSLWSVFIHPKGSHKNMIKSLIQVILGATKGKRPRCTIHFQCPIESCSPYWSKTMKFLSFPQGLEDLHIQKGTMSIQDVNTMEELGGISWRSLWLLKTRFNLWSMQIQPDSETLSMVIESNKIKDQLGTVSLLLFMNVFISECTFEKCKPCFNVSVCME